MSYNAYRNDAHRVQGDQSQVSLIFDKLSSFTWLPFTHEQQPLNEAQAFFCSD